tara:strand:- start:474 stop:962 length:489 start_codon:yes stop_codon:yes gene_type:complete
MSIKKMTIKRSNKPKERRLPEASVVKNKHGTFRMEWASNNKVRSRRVDQRVIDRLVLDGKIFDTEYQMAQWYFELASSSIRMPNLVSNMNMEKVSGGGDYISNKQMNAMLRLRRVDKLIEEKFKDKIKLLRNTVIYDESIKEKEVPALKKILKYILDNQSKF